MTSNRYRFNRSHFTACLQCLDPTRMLYSTSGSPLLLLQYAAFINLSKTQTPITSPNRSPLGLAKM